MHKSGFVNILGNPNVGKSTLMNTITGEKLSIITAKVQTTRHRIIGIVNDENYQIIFSDTPGIINTPKYLMQKSMMGFVNEALQDADIFLYLVEPNNDTYDADIVKKLNESDKPIILAINKIDLSDQAGIEKKAKFWGEVFPKAIIIPISALHNFNINLLKDKIVELLPENPPFYDKDELTDKPMRFFVSEIIREKILLQFDKEIPYSVEVITEEYKETGNLVKIRSIIHVLRETQKAIIIGHNGSAIKKLGTSARKDIEEFTGMKVYLELSVKVSKDWRDNEQQLKRFGYGLTD